MWSSFVLASSILIASVFAACSGEQRIYYSGQVPYAYAQTTPGATYAAFDAIPFGVPDLAGACTTVIYPNGGSGVTVGTTGQGVVNFGTETRQAFSSVTGQYVDFPENGTTVIYTNVTLGVRSDLPVPITFSGQVYLDFNTECRISAVRAFAEIPTYINGQPTDIYKLLGIPKLPLITKRGRYMPRR